MAVGGHRWPSAGVRRGVTGGVASLAREESGEEDAGLARPVGPSSGRECRSASGPRARVGHERKRARLAGPSEGRREGSGPRCRFCFSFSKMINSISFCLF
jgi:hypothetical protein